MEFLKFILLSVLLLPVDYVEAQSLAEPEVSTQVAMTVSDKKKLSEEIEKIRKFNQVPGLAIAVVNERGIVWAKGFGIRKSGSNLPVTPETLFSVESQTKMFTTLGVMRAVQSGILDLNTSVSHYLPNLKVYSLFQKNPAQLITLKNLLSHTAGFAHEAPLGNNFNSNVTFSEHIQSILNGVWLQFPIGEGYNYSNVDMDLAGYILQITSKMPYPEYMNKEVLNPLGMNHSTFSIQTFQNSENHAVGQVPGLKEAPINHSIISAGGLYSNVIDMSHYIEFQLNHGIYQGQFLLTPCMLETMLTIPFLQPGQREGNALGIWKGERLHTTYYSHLGRGFGFSSDLEWYPDYHLGVVVLMNKYDMNNVDIKVTHLLIDYLINQRIQRQKAQLFPKIQGNYVSNGGSITLKENDKGNLVLSGDINDGPTGNDISLVDEALSYMGNNRFYSSQSHDQYRFIASGVTGVKTIERVRDGYMWFFNDGPSLKTGPNKSYWKELTGIYSLYGYGPVAHFKVHIQDGYLYLDSIRLIQKTKNIFITPNGQVLKFNQKHLRWAGLPLLD